MYKIIKDYRDNAAFRHSFNELAEKTFGLNFEDWYLNGFWGDNYNPYSIVIDDKVVANVSVNKTDMMYDGSIKHFLQLGTVMTDEAYRNQGLIRKIMEQIALDFDDNVDGIYLFGGDNVLNFYPKFGFKKSREFLYSKKILNTGDCQFSQIIMDNSDAWQQLQNGMKHNVFQSKLDMVNNPELILFYVTKFMQESVYYHKETDTYVIADMEDNQLYIHTIFSSSLKELDTILALFGEKIKTVTLGFTPKVTTDYDVSEIPAQDCTFFIKGDALSIIEAENLRIPSLSHA